MARPQAVPPLPEAKMMSSKSSSTFWGSGTQKVQFYFTLQAILHGILSLIPQSLDLTLSLQKYSESQRFPKRRATKCDK